MKSFFEGIIRERRELQKEPEKYPGHSSFEKQFEGWENILDPNDFNLCSILEFRKNKDDFSFDKSTEHTLISKFVSHIATITTNTMWKKAASSLNGDGVLQCQAQ
ncbi:hypothetical protein G9A89_014928 [Geosiphon pyriformis]|nr:hypothetical protein G9A89_014928 [Geosiphon pyriformis]